MANVERHDFFPTCLYRFKHDFEENELDSMISHIDLNSLSEHKYFFALIVSLRKSKVWLTFQILMN